MSFRDPSARDDLLALVRRAAEGSTPALDRMRGDYAGSSSASRRASVLILFGFIGGRLSVLLTQRADSMRTHAGQVAFPGGAQDSSDDDAVAAAVREAEEETGLRAEDFTVLGALDPVPVAVSGFLVTPVLAWWDSPGVLEPVSEDETSRVFTVAVEDFTDPAVQVRTELRRGTHTFRGPGYEVADALVWGFTAFLLEAVLAELGWAEPGKDRRVISPW